MKLVFAAGEFPSTLLQQGVKRIGSAFDADIALSDPAILPQHCELQVNAQGVMLNVARGAASDKARGCYRGAAGGGDCQRTCVICHRPSAFAINR